MDKVYQIYDRAYKQLFSNKTIFRQLIESFVKEPWVKEVNFDSLERIDKTFISHEYSKTESDIIYKLNFRNQELYIYVLLEFQSSVDKFMPVRCLNYITNFYLDLVKSKGDSIKLPAIFPLVLYNGDENWNYSTEISDLIENNKILGDYALNFKYFLIKENNYSVEELMSIGNIVSTLFLSEAHYNIELLKDEILKIFDKEEDKIAIKLFLNFFKQLAFNEKIETVDYNIIEETYRDKEEVKSMLITAARKENERIRNQAIAEGIAQGISEGIAQGIVEGKLEGKIEGKIEGIAEGQLEKSRSYVIKLLTKKFKTLPQDLENKINTCNDINILDSITESIFDITSLDEINL